jgi:hypothetical protein
MDTPTLLDMGIRNPHEIARYNVESIDGRSDELTIIYEREPGSLLPKRRVYEFGRAPRTSISHSGDAGTVRWFEISPVLLAAIEELDALLKK